MPFTAGDKLGAYEIVSLLGAGGMGEVYRARDTKLKRDVALKVLPEAFARDPDRMGRFQREAEVLASLNHPNIAHLYGISESEGTRALVMELVEGETLPCPSSIETAVNYAKQIAEALEYAHERGVMHRDLKPANVKVTPEGVVKLLDFGLAKALDDGAHAEGRATDSPTLTLGATRAGVIMGTAAYMSPEQASGKTADRRADIWSFGAVLYEMLAGKKAFGGESVSDTLATVLKLDPDWDALPAAAPGSIRALAKRCLTKDRKQRLQAIGEARIVLENPAAGQANSLPAYSAPSPPWTWVAATSLLAVIAAGASWGWLKPKPQEPREVIRFTAPAGQTNGLMPPPALSRDGSRLAMVFNQGQPITLRMLDQFESRPIPGTEGAFFVCFSPDSEWIAFLSNNGILKKVPVSGGAALTLAEGFSGGGPLSWADDGSIFFVSGAGLMRLLPAGGKPQIIVPLDSKKGETNFNAPQLLPGGKIVLFSIFDSQAVASAKLAVVNLQTGERKIVLDGVGTGWYAPTGSNPSFGHIVYGRNGSLFAVPFDVNRLQAGSAVPLLDGVMGVGALTTFGFSDSGTLAYATGGSVDLGSATLVWVDRKGAERPVAGAARSYVPNFLQLSPDGGRAALMTEDLGALSDLDLWVYDLTRGVPTRVTFGGMNIGSVWTLDGKRLMYLYSADNGQHFELRSVAADGSGSPATILANETLPRSPSSVSPDGKVLLGERPRGQGPAAQVGSDIWTLPLGGAPGESKPVTFLESPYHKTSARFSPDGKWLAYASNESGRDEIYVVPYPGPGQKTQVSAEGGTAPVWGRNGRELFYRSGSKMMAVEVAAGTPFRAGATKVLFERAGLTDGFDLAPDGQRFLLMKTGGAPGQAAELRVVVNWFDELRQRVPLPK